MTTQGFTVSAEWLEANLGRPGLSIVDASLYPPGQPGNAHADYDKRHIPGAVFFNHELVVEPGSSLPHTLPSPRVFATFAGSMGISVDDTIVIYDKSGFFSAPRAWWMFRAMGAKKVHILEGGLDGWIRDGRPVTDEPTKTAPCVFDVAFDESRVVSLSGMKDIVADGSRQIADARPAGRFTGSDPEPRAGLRGGHMPGARSVPASSLSRDGKMLAPDELRQRFEQAGVDLSGPVVTSCGSGVTAAVVSLALETLGHRDHKLYDGSWTEWAGLSDTPIETGKP